jgi:hypothetical protein
LFKTHEAITKCRTAPWLAPNGARFDSVVRFFRGSISEY